MNNNGSIGLCLDFDVNIHSYKIWYYSKVNNDKATIKTILQYSDRTMFRVYTA